MKSLAIFGGPPAFAEPLHVGRPNMPGRSRFEELCRRALDAGRLTNHGPLVEEFEARIARMANARHCIATSSCTTGLQVVFRALDLRGDVILPAFTAAATANAAAWVGLNPVFVDVLEDSHLIDPKQVERAMGSNAAAVVGVHLWGEVCDVSALSELCGRRGLPLIFDAAHALGCTHGGKAVGGFGLVEVFSFHATKFLQSTEGGAVVTNDDSLAASIRDIVAGRSQGGRFGTNAHMTELSAAMGMANLDHLDALIEHNQRRWREYKEALAGVPGVRLLRLDPAQRRNHQYIVVEIDSTQFGVHRDELNAVLRAENVLAQRHFTPALPRRPAFECFVSAETRFPVAERICDRVLQLPTGLAVALSDVERIGEVMHAIHAQSEAIRKLFAKL